jgi:predicted GNAT family N-acyltransferase
MEIKPYKPDKFDQCVRIFISNQDKFFADYELEEFKTFLNQIAPVSSYFVLLDNGEVVACGGYERYQEEIILTWGMVRRDLQGQGYGNELTKFRLNAINAEYPNRTIKIDTSQYSKGFYENRGFIIQDVEKDDFSPGLDKYIMTFDPP